MAFKFSSIEDIPAADLRKVSDGMIGIVLMNGERDSNGQPIHPFKMYEVYKHLPSGKLIITDTGRTMEPPRRQAPKTPWRSSVTK
jgi:hypothetical protein